MLSRGALGTIMMPTLVRQSAIPCSGFHVQASSYRFLPMQMINRLLFGKWLRRFKMGHQPRINRRAAAFEGLETRRLLATFAVLNTNDDGTGSLRAAIVAANANLGSDTIEFSIANADKKIALQSALPTIVDTVVIDATTQPGFSDRPLVQIDGAAVPTGGVAGLFLKTFDSVVRGLSITNFAHGIFVEGWGGNKFEGNFLGLAPNGSSASNALNGLIVVQSFGNTIGGATPLQRNVISGNGEFGIRVEGNFATGNRIQGNYIGSDVTGVNARPNRLDGILVSNASGTIVGTDGDGVADAGEMNLLSGNGERGVRFYQAVDNVIAGNFIGLAINGLSALPNGTVGVEIDTNSSRNRIGTNGDSVSDATERNVISGNRVSGVRIDASTATIVAGNFIGTTVNGLEPLGNVGIGLFLSNGANLNRIGTNADGLSDATEANVISGNGTNAIEIYASHRNIVAGNLLGLTSAGDSALANGHSGLWITGGSTENLVGTNDDGSRDEVERNVISGNSFQGVAITHLGTDRNVVAGNYIGTDKSGTMRLGNETGVLLSAGARANIIGATKIALGGNAAGNLISGSRLNGIRLTDAGTSLNEIRGNRIGLSANGQNALANDWAGITIEQAASSNIIGGIGLGQANFIGGNKRNGLCIVSGADANSVDGNFIGLAPDSVTPLPNGLTGITIDDSSNNSIGVISANSIAHHQQAGIAVTGGLSRGNQLSKNLLYQNLGLAIDLGNDGPTSNDASDADVGPNQLQNFPTLVSASTTGSTLQIAGGLVSAPNMNYRIEYFAKEGAGDAVDTMSFMGFGNVMTDRSGQVNWVFELSGSATLNQSIIATATSARAGTSEFSTAVPVQSQLPLTIALPTAGENLGNVQATVSRGAQPIAIPLTVSVSSGDPSLVQVPAVVEIPAGQSSVTFNITVVNDTVWKVHPATIISARLGTAAVGSASIVIADDDSPWHNFVRAVDVSGDGALSPLDALLVINTLNAGRSKSVYELSQPTNGSKLFADVNNDEVISPIDALLVINQLNSRASAEGEAAESDVENESRQFEFMFDVALQDFEVNRISRTRRFG